MRLVFDRGTVLLLDVDRDVQLTDVPGLLWDPRVDSYRAPACQYAEIASALARRGVRVSDSVRPAGHFAGQWRDIELRNYQVEALNAWTRASCRGVVVLPTGSGKTRVALAAMARLAVPALCLVPTRVLLDQWCREIEAMYKQRVGRFGDGSRVVAAITVATYESAFRHMPEFGDKFDLLIIDEAHHFGSGVRDEALEMCVARARLGLTATPVADPATAERLASLMGPKVYELGIGDLAGSFLAAFDIVTVGIDLTGDERARYERLIARYRTAHRVFRRHNPGASWKEFSAAAGRTSEGRAALRAWRESRRLVSLCSNKRAKVRDLLGRHRDSRVLVFVADNEAAYAISSENLVMPLTCDIGRSERAEALEWFRKGELRVLVSARVLNEGLDVPDADVAIVVGGALGGREHVQRVGRLLRPTRGKRATVYELVARNTLEVEQAARRRSGLAARKTADIPTSR